MAHAAAPKKSSARAAYVESLERLAREAHEAGLYAESAAATAAGQRAATAQGPAAQAARTEAIARWTEALQRVPGRVPWLLALARLELDAGQVDAAERHAKEAMATVAADSAEGRIAVSIAVAAARERVRVEAASLPFHGRPATCRGHPPRGLRARRLQTAPHARQQKPT